MKGLWNNFKVAFAMFSRIPMPKADWAKENMQYMLCFFPWIGAVIGAIALLGAWAGERLGYGSSFVCAVLVLVPVLVTGGIHVDGLLDTADALSSWQEQKRRLEILKDSHAGAFAVITACCYFLAAYGSCTQFWTVKSARQVMALSFFLSRSLSGLGVVMIPKAREDGTVAEFSRNAAERRVRNVLVCYVLFAGSLMVFIHPVFGGLSFTVSILTFFWYRKLALHYFGGTTGDLSGFFLCSCELACAVMLAVLSVLVR